MFNTKEMIFKQKTTKNKNNNNNDEIMMLPRMGEFRESRHLNWIAFSHYESKALRHLLPTSLYCPLRDGHKYLGLR